MTKNNSKNISKSLSGKYSQKILDHAKQFDTNALKTASKREMQKVAKATVNLIGNKNANKITKVSRTSPRNSSGTVTNETENVGLDRVYIERERE